MPYESPNIVIIPTTGFEIGKSESRNGSDLNKAETLISVTKKILSTPHVAKNPQSEVVIPKDTIQETSCRSVQGIIPSTVIPKSDSVNNNIGLENSNNMDYTSWASNLQSVSRPGNTMTTKPKILFTSNDSRGQLVCSTSEINDIASRDEDKNVASVVEKSNPAIKNTVNAKKTNVARTDESKIDNAKSIVASISEKKPPIKMNLLPCCKVAKNADISTAPTMVPTTEHVTTGTRPYNDITWTSPLMPQTVNGSWIPPYTYQPTYPILNMGYGVPISEILSQQYPTHVYTQNTDTNMNANYVHQRENHSYTHYYTPSYKSPMDSAWLNEQYYAQLVNDQSYKYFNHINKYENINNKVPETIGDTQTIDKKKYLEKTAGNEEIIKPNENVTSSKISLKKSESKPLKNITQKKSINPDSFNLGNDFVETTSQGKSEPKKKSRETSESETKKSTSKNYKGKSKPTLSSESEERKKITEKLQKQIKIIDNLIAKKRSQAAIKTVKVRDEEDCPPKNKKSSKNLKADKHRKQNPDSKIKTKRLRENIETRLEPKRKKVRLNSNSEYQPKKCTQRNSDNDIILNNHANSIKSVIKSTQIQHPRIQAPESEDFESDDDSKSDFDLRSILSRANYKRYIRDRSYYDSQIYDKSKTDHENLLITINQNEDSNDNLQLKDVAAKPKPKSKKYKKIQLVINFLCDKQDSSENSSSDENELKEGENSTVKVIDTESVFKSDLSFLDDINVDEIVSSLRHQQQTITNTNKFVALKNAKEPVISDSNKYSEKPPEKFVQPIVIKSEIKTEKEDPEEHFNYYHENAAENTLSEGTTNLGPVHSGVSKESSDGNEAQKANCLDVAQNIKQEKDFEIEDKAECEKELSCPKGRQSPSLQDLVSALSEKYSQPVNQFCKAHENYEDIVKKEKESQVLTTAINNIDPINADLMDEDTQDLNIYCSCEPMDIDKTSTFCIPDMQIPIKEENNNDLNTSFEIENTVSIQLPTMIHKTNPITEDCADIEKPQQNEITKDNLVASAMVTNPIIIGVENTVTHVSQSSKINATESGSQSQSYPTLAENAKDEMRIGASISIAPVVKIEPDSVHDNENAKKNADIKNTVTHTKQDVIKEVSATPADIPLQMSKPVNSSTPITSDKGPLCDNTVNKSLSKKVPQTTKPPNNTNITNKAALPTNTTRKGKVIVQEDKAKIVKPAAVVKPAATVPQKVDTSKKDTESTDKPRTVQMKPSLKDNKILALKLEKKIFECAKLKMSITSMIHSGRYSKIFLCESPSKTYALKFIKDEANHTSLGLNKENMLLALQLNIPRQNLHTIFLVSSFEMVGNWCFLTEYYPKNLQYTLKTTVLDMDTVQELSRQLVSAVMMMRNNNIVHSDINPRHILVDAANRRLKVCGFDQSYYMEELREVIPNIGSAVYRAPEIIIGFSADFAIDVWAMAVVIFEMITGMKLFGLKNYNNYMLFCQMSLLGYLPMDMIQMSPYAFKHFVEAAFKRVLGIRKSTLHFPHEFGPKKRIFPMLKTTVIQRWTQGLRKKTINSDMKKLSHLCYLLDDMLVLDPRQRIPIGHVFADPFFEYKNTEMFNDTRFLPKI